MHTQSEEMDLLQTDRTRIPNVISSLVSVGTANPRGETLRHSHAHFVEKSSRWSLPRLESTIVLGSWLR